MSTGQPIAYRNESDENGNPSGGHASGVGISISWQNGPLSRGPERKEPNGAFVEDVLEICAARIQFYQSSSFRCRENAIALTHLETALLWLKERTRAREARGVEGTYEV